MANKPGWDTRDYGTVGKTFGHDGAGADYAAIPELNILQNDCARSNPTMVPNLYFTDIHRKGVGRGTATELMIRICYVNIRSKHIVVPNHYRATGINHDVTVEVIEAANPNTNAGASHGGSITWV